MTGMGSLEDKERQVLRKTVAKAKQSEGLQRVWRGKRHLKKTSPERKRAAGKERGRKNVKVQETQGKDWGKRRI